jgi:two-component system, LuxR family, sensor kinase FixL
VEMAGERCYIIIIRDVTDRKLAESMLQEQQRELAHLSRVAALGELSGALAHELNQPLAAILANARAAQRMISGDHQNLTEVRDILEDIALDDMRAGEVISRLRSLLKKGGIQARPVSLDEIVSEVLDLLHSDLIQRRVFVSTQLASSLPPILGDRVQLQQVLLNLIVNACDAMADQPPRDRKITITDMLTEQGAVRLAVSDQGPGVAEGQLDQIFEPFVTTKEAGLGLGLAICRSIVTAHGGRLWAVNAPDRGATFLMEFDPIEARSPLPPVLDHHPAGEFKPAGTR